MAPRYRIDPRIRALGKARLDVTRRARDEGEWQKMWRAPRYSFPFAWGEGWRACFQYFVEDFAAEIGFFIDVLGFPVSAFSTTYALFTSPDHAFFFAVRALPEGFESTPPDTIRLQFMVSNFSEAIQELERRGVTFEVRPEVGGPAVAVFRSPHGVPIELWPAPPVRTPQANAMGAGGMLTGETLSERQAWSPSEVKRDEALDEGEDEVGGEMPAPGVDEGPYTSDEPIYVDDEDASQVAHLDEQGTLQSPLALSPRQSGPRRAPRPALSPRTAPFSVQKPPKGNGTRPFPTLDEGDR